VPYRGVGASYPDLIAGHVQIMFDSMPGSIEFIRTGRLRPLAVTTATRSPALPDLPTVGDFVPGYEASAVHGVGAPHSTPAEIVEKLNRAINATLAEPAIKARLVDMGATCSRGDVARAVRENRVHLYPHNQLCADGVPSPSMPVSSTSVRGRTNRRRRAAAQ
jgi:tripartite-type tricarboxylate transporter receptor subunit TctC